MKNKFQIIKSHLEYGHKVEVQINWYSDKKEIVTIVCTHPEEHYLLDTYGRCWNEATLNEVKVLSVTPIPHRYKKLEVGTKVDVLEEYDRTLAAEGPYRVHQNDGEYTIAIALPHKVIGGVPLWAITPHVEEEEAEFKECYECAKKAGSPILCSQCLWARENWPRLTNNMLLEELSNAGLNTILRMRGLNPIVANQEGRDLAIGLLVQLKNF